MSCREIPLAAISLELISLTSVTDEVDTDDPLVVIEEKERFLLVDGFKRYFSLREIDAQSAWAIVKPWSRLEAKIGRFKRNNPTRKTALTEELETLQDLHHVERLSVTVLSRMLKKSRKWIDRRLEVLKRLCEEVSDLLPARLFRITTVERLARLPAKEQVSTALSLADAHLSLGEANCFLEILAGSNELERAIAREDPRRTRAVLRCR